MDPESPDPTEPTPSVSNGTVVNESEKTLQADFLPLVQPEVSGKKPGVSLVEWSSGRRFLKALLDAYLVKVQDWCESPMSDAPVIPLVDIHPMVAESSGKGEK